jgi:hypothetical protein
MSRNKFIALVGAVALCVTPAAALAGGKNPPPKQCKGGKVKGKKKCQPSHEGRMTGQGTIDSVYGRSHHEFRNSVCNSDRFPDLKVQWEGNRFDLTSYSSPLRCIDTPADEGQPRAGFDTIVGQGTGTLNGVGGATTTFRFTDAGEPGRNDTATITIMDANGNIVFQLTDAKILEGGNHQAHAH